MEDRTFTWLKSFCLDQSIAILFTDLEVIDGEFTGRGQQKTFGPPDMLAAKSRFRLSAPIKRKPTPTMLIVSVVSIA